MQATLRCLCHYNYRVLLQEMKIKFTGRGRLIMLNDEANSDQITKWPLAETEKFLFSSRFFSRFFEVVFFELRADSPE